MQTKKQSIFEVITNTLVGFIVAIISQLIIFPVFDINIPLADNLLLGLYFMAIGMARSYLLRRYFNKRHING